MSDVPYGWKVFDDLPKFYTDPAVATPYRKEGSTRIAFFTSIGRQVGPEFHSIEEARSHAKDNDWKEIT